MKNLQLTWKASFLLMVANPHPLWSLVWYLLPTLWLLPLSPLRHPLNPHYTINNDNINNLGLLRLGQYPYLPIPIQQYHSSPFNVMSLSLYVEYAEAETRARYSNTTSCNLLSCEHFVLQLSLINSYDLMIPKNSSIHLKLGIHIMPSQLKPKSETAAALAWTKFKFVGQIICGTKCRRADRSSNLLTTYAFLVMWNIWILCILTAASKKSSLARRKFSP